MANHHHDHDGYRSYATRIAETYGAGRYLDVEPTAEGAYVLDFNLAYHPLCVFSEDYSCPLTPAENRLPVRVEAGERLPAVPSAHSVQSAR